MLLGDLGRWTFGALLAERAAFHAIEPDRLSSEVRAYRYGILCCALKDEALRSRAIAETRVAAPWELMLDWAEFGWAMPWNNDAELKLAARFIERLQNFGVPGEAMGRFARGKAFKYGRRVMMLSEKAP